MQISRAALKAAIDEGHRRGMKITGHLCSVTYGEAADLGIDNLEHGFFAATDFVADKQPDVCPGQARGQQTIAALDENGEPFKALVKKLVDKHVALTSTLTVFETFTPGRPMPPGLDVLTPQLKDSFQRAYERAAQNAAVGLRDAVSQGDARSSARSRRPAACWSPAPIRPVPAASCPATRISGRSSCWSRRGSRRSKAISIGTLNGAKYLGRDARIGSIAARQAGGSRRRRRRSVDDDRGHPPGRDGVQERRRLRSGEADRVGEGVRWESGESQMADG